MKDNRWLISSGFNVGMFALPDPRLETGGGRSGMADTCWAVRATAPLYLDPQDSVEHGSRVLSTGGGDHLNAVSAAKSAQ
jgi:hypothetical protein